MNLQSGVQIGDFRIERLLGHGGMGIVFLAQQVSLNRPVALKIMGPALHLQADIARFQREAQAVAKLNHPRIAKVYFVGQSQGYSYLAMEYIDGDSLRMVLNRIKAVRDPKQPIESILQLRQEEGGDAPEMRFDIPTGSEDPPSPPEDTQADPDSITPEARKLIESKDYVHWCCEVMRDVVQALNHAHKQGVIHRDIKPENLLLDRQGQVHVIDFGLARFFEDVTVTHSGSLIGTPVYMAPEQVTGRVVVDPRTDIYSLGLVFYEFLTLKRPFSSPTREGVIRQIVAKAIPPVTWQNRAIPRDLESVVHKATAKDADERYQTALEFAEDLRNHFERRPVIASPYRYQFDTREIAAERPNSVWIVFVILLGYSLYFFLSFLNQFAFSSSALYVGSIVLLLITLFVFIACGIVAGYNMLRWVGIIVSLTCCSFCGYAIYYYAGSFFNPPLFSDSHLQSSGLILEGYRSSLNIPMTVFFTFNFCMFVAIAMLLFQRRTKAWFRYARHLRSEHKRQTSPR